MSKRRLIPDAAPVLPQPLALRVPAGAPAPGIVVPHAAWRSARSTLLRTAVAGPGTILLLGPAGTGKTLLLRHLETILREHGTPVTLLPQGDLPYVLQAGTVLLIDEADRMDHATLARLAAQRETIVVLATLPAFADHVPAGLPAPTIVMLEPLTAAQLDAFVADFLHRIGRSPADITRGAVTRLAAHTAGIPRLVTMLLNAAFALASAPPLTQAAIDDVATLRWSAPGDHTDGHRG